jgi:Protein of unknown function (DUF2637)
VSDLNPLVVFERPQAGSPFTPPTPPRSELFTAPEPPTGGFANVVEVTPKAPARGTTRFHADTPAVLVILLVLIGLLSVASFTVSFAGLYAAAAWAVGDVPWLQFAVPLMLDIAIIGFTLALFVERDRGEKVWGTWIAIGVFAAASATSNVLHTLVVSTATTLPQLVVGAVISGGAPVLLAFAVDKIAVKVFKKAE